MSPDPKIQLEGKDYFDIGCKKCGFSDWRVCTDGNEFVCSCRRCKHILKIPAKELKSEPDDSIKR